MSDIAERLLAGEQRALSRLITLLERGDVDAVTLRRLSMVKPEGRTPLVSLDLLGLEKVPLLTS